MLLVEPVGERRGRRLVDDPEHLEPGDLPGLLGGLALRVVEVRGHRDDGLVHRVAQVRLGVALQLAEDLRGDLLRRPLLAVDVEAPVLRAHVPLHGPDRSIRVRDGLALGDLADQDLAVLGEPHHRGGGAGAFGVRDDDRLAGLEHRDHRVRRPQVDPHRSCHSLPPSLDVQSASHDRTLSACVSTSCLGEGIPQSPWVLSFSGHRPGPLGHGPGPRGRARGVRGRRYARADGRSRPRSWRS